MLSGFRKNHIFFCLFICIHTIMHKKSLTFAETIDFSIFFVIIFYAFV